MNKALVKAERLLQIEVLLLEHPEGLRRAQIAARLGVNRSTVGRDLASLTKHVPIVEEDDGHLWIDATRYLAPVRLSVQEIESVRLAFRLFSRKIRMPFPHASASLRKLANAVERTSSALSHRLAETADSIDSHSFPSFTHKYRAIMENLIAACFEYRTVLLRHLSMRRGEEVEYLFQPYCIEPYPDGNSLHAIGFCPELDQMRTFKLERIHAVHLTKDRFEVPTDFDIDLYTSTAWGVWGRNNRQPITIVLQFSASVAERVRETVWHESQSMEDRADGSVIFRATVAEPLEMYPWIRGWGADVEILEPTDLRKRFQEEVERMRKMYGEG